MLTSPLAFHLHSIMLGVRDLQRSIPFYRDTLGLTLAGSFGDYAFFRFAAGESAANEPMITLSAQLVRARPATAPAPVEVVLTVESVRAAYARLLERGLTFLSEPRTIDGTNDVANFEDPDGHLFSLYGPP